MMDRVELYVAGFGVRQMADLPRKIRLTLQRASLTETGCQCISSALCTSLLDIAVACGVQTAAQTQSGKLPVARGPGRSVEKRVRSDAEGGAVSDTELLRRVATGDAVAFADFYDRSSTLLFSVAMKVLDDVEEAEEVLQESARLVWERAPLYSSALGKPSSWAVVIARNKAIDRLRVLRRKSEVIARIREEDAADFQIRGRRMPNDAVTNEAGTLLRDALRCLPEEQRTAIELAFLAGLSQAEVAAQLGQPLGTIKARIRRGMLKLRELLEEQL